jgi:hypothetical protein
MGGPQYPAGPVQAYPYQPPPTPERRGPGGISQSAWIVIVILVILVGLAIMAFAFFGTIIEDIQPEEDVETIHNDVILGDGAHFRQTLTEGVWDDVEVALNITSNGSGAFDVYIMDLDQYENAYGPNVTAIAFSALHSWENVSRVNTRVELPRGSRFYYVVIDNRDTALTPNDATPTGIITVDMTVQVITTFVW